MDKESGLDISTESRKNIYVVFRSWYYYFCYKYADDAYGFRYVGELVNKDHSVVIYGYNKFIDRFPFDRELQLRTKAIEDKFCKHFNISVKPMHHKDSDSKTDIIDFKRKSKRNNLLEEKTKELKSIKLKLERRDATIAKQEKIINELRKKAKLYRYKGYRYESKIKQQ